MSVALSPEPPPPTAHSPGSVKVWQTFLALRSPCVDQNPAGVLWSAHEAIVVQSNHLQSDVTGLFERYVV